MKPRWMIAVGAALALALLTLPDVIRMHGVGQGEAYAAAACAADAKVANLGFTLKDMNGQDVHLASYKGKVVLLNFWATWCGPCKYEIPAFVELQEKYRDQGFQVLGLSVDDPVAKLKPFAQQYKMNYPVLVGLGREDVQEAFGPIWGIPISFFISRDGKICKTHAGLATKDQVEKDIKALL